MSADVPVMLVDLLHTRSRELLHTAFRFCAVGFYVILRDSRT
jgi:hypothetical protein